MFNDEEYYTPEGHYLPRPLLLPDVRDFSELLEYVSEWDFATMSHLAGVPPQPDRRPAPVMIGDNEVGPYCTVDDGVKRHRGIAVIAKQPVIDAVKNRIVTDDDHLSFKVIVHTERNRALVILDHGYIIGSHWLAYIDPTTIPAPAKVPA